MDYIQDPALAAMLRGSSRGPPPRRGENMEFDQYCDRMMDNLDAEETDFSEMRKAAWATYGVGPPSRANGYGSSSHSEEDAELARVLALSAREHKERDSTGRPTLPTGDDDDEELRRAIAMSEEESRAPKRRRREDTPEEERKMLADALAASLAHQPASAVEVISDDEDESEVSPTAKLEPSAIALPPVLSDRAQMEQERLARQRAREASGSNPKADPSVTAAPAPGKSAADFRTSRIATMADVNSVAGSSTPAPGPTLRDTNGSTSDARPSMHHPLQSTSPFPTDAAGEYYLDGELRHVALTLGKTVFIQDFLPQSSSASPRTSPLGDEFVDRFRDLLIHIKVHKAIRHQVENHPFGKRIPLDPSEALQDLSKYDFSRVRVKLVMSVPGKYTGFEQMNEYGLCRLGNLLKEEKWIPPPGQRVEGEYQGSSLGNYTLEWIDTFHRFMNGKEARDLVGRPKAKEWPPMKVLFPSLDTVSQSELGRQGGGTMFVGQAWKAVTKRLFHDANSKRGGVLMHSKVLIALFEEQPNLLGSKDNSQDASGSKLKRKADELDKPDIGGWAYVGSHNFTPSAWGNVKLNDRPPTMSISNYELGIVFPLPRDNAKAAADAIAPYRRPSRPYNSSDLPWDQKMKGEGKLTMHTPK